MTTILAFVFVIGVLVFVHELGHFLAARRVGVRVLTFSIGFGPRIFGFTRGGTDYCISAVPLALDLGRPDAAAQLRGMLDERGIRVHSLLNNAGFGAKGAFIDSDPERMQQMVALNIATLVSLTREFLPDLVSGNGVLVNLASTAAYQPVPSMAVYAASKAFVLSFTESIAYETRGTGLGVLALSPGPTRTEFFDVVGETVATPGGFETADEVVTRALKELDRAHPRASVVSGRMNAIQARLVGMLPRRLALNVSGRVA